MGENFCLFLKQTNKNNIVDIVLQNPLSLVHHNRKCHVGLICMLGAAPRGLMDQWFPEAHNELDVLSGHCRGGATGR